MTAADARRLAIAVMLAAVDQRDDDMHALLADADRAELAIAVGGLALMVAAVVEAVPSATRPSIREYLSARAMEMAAWPQT